LNTVKTVFTVLTGGMVVKTVLTIVKTAVLTIVCNKLDAIKWSISSWYNARIIADSACFMSAPLHTLFITDDVYWHRYTMSRDHYVIQLRQPRRRRHRPSSGRQAIRSPSNKVGI